MSKVDKKRQRPSAIDRVVENKKKYTFKTKDGRDAGTVVSEFILRNWSVVPIVFAVVGLLVAFPLHQTKATRLRSSIETWSARATKSRSELTTMQNGLKPKIVKKVVDTKVSNATTAGTEIGQAFMTVLSADTGGDVSKQDREVATTIIQKYLSSDDADRYIEETWPRATTWTIDFKSHAPYEGNTSNVIWTMTKDSKLMGVVTATYDSSSNSFTDVKVSYTVAGMSEQNKKGRD